MEYGKGMARGVASALLVAAIFFWALPGVAHAAPTAAVRSDNGIEVGVTYGEKAGSAGVDIAWDGEADVTQDVWESFLKGADGKPLPVPEQQPTLEPSGGSPVWTDIVIEQDMLSFADFTAPFMAVYRIDASKAGRPVYSDVVGIEIKADDKNYQAKTYAIGEGRVPAGADVTVSLLYAGPAYSLHSSQEDVLTWKAVAGGNKLTARFALAYDFDNAMGSGIVNPFHADPVDEEGIVLPVTGSRGTGGVMAAGAVLSLAGLAGALLFRRKGKDGGLDA